MNTHVTIKVAVNAGINSDGTVLWSASLSSDELIPKIEAQHSVKERRAMYAKATRSRMKEGLIRIEWGTHTIDLFYAEYVRSTSQHHIIRVGKAETKFRRGTGRPVGNGHSWRIHKEDLVRLNSGVVKPKEKSAT